MFSVDNTTVICGLILFLFLGNDSMMNISNIYGTFLVLIGFFSSVI